MTAQRSPRKKSLNTYNSDRAWNCSLIHRDTFNKYIKVTTLNEKEITQELEQLRLESNLFKKKNDKAYMIFHTKYNNDYLHELLFDHGGEVIYFTPTLVPYHITRMLATSSQVSVVYTCKAHYSKADIDNIMQTNVATQVKIDVPIVYPDINPYELLFILYPLRNNVDKVQLSFPPLREDEIGDRDKAAYYKQGELYHLKAYYRYLYAEYIRPTIAKWKMNLYVVCDNDSDIQRIVDLVKENHGQKLMESDIHVK